jgi:hypothetical protein
LLIFCYFYFRIISNYEYSKGDFLTTQSILDDADRLNQDVNGIFLGQSLKNIWGEKVRKSSAVSEKGSGYENLRKRIVDETCKRRIEQYSEEIVEKIKQLCSTADIGWIVNHSILEKRVTLLKIPSVESSAFGTTVEGRRLVCEVTIILDPPNVVLRTHGEVVSLKDIIGEEFMVVSLNVIDTVIRLVEARTLCLGHLSISRESDRESQLLQVPVSGSRLLSTTTNDSQKEKKLVSTSCLLIAFGKDACKNCVYVAKLWRNRERKIKMKDQSIAHRKCNLRFLAREGLKEKINTQRKEIRSDMARERRMKDEMIDFSEEDCADLQKVFGGIESKAVPPEMKLLWDVQMKQLSVKSPKGYRWHPRFFIKLLYFLFILIGLYYILGNHFFLLFSFPVPQFPNLCNVHNFSI